MPETTSKAEVASLPHTHRPAEFSPGWCFDLEAPSPPLEHHVPWKFHGLAGHSPEQELRLPHGFPAGRGEFSRFALDRHVDQAYDGRGRSILRLDA